MIVDFFIDVRMLEIIFISDWCIIMQFINKVVLGQPVYSKTIFYFLTLKKFASCSQLWQFCGWDLSGFARLLLIIFSQALQRMQTGNVKYINLYYVACKISSLRNKLLPVCTLMHLVKLEINGTIDCGGDMTLILITLNISI